MTTQQLEASLFDQGTIDGIAKQMDLRAPNKAALENIAYTLAYHFETEGKSPPFECVIDVATGVGKTYVLAAIIEYYAQLGIRNFAVIVPRTPILKKTLAQFSPNNPRSLLGGMDVEPVVITSENFDTPQTSAAMDDPQQVKLYLFTVQSLTKPTSKQGRRTHDFQEALGKPFYDALQAAEDLVVISDEHHALLGREFSKAVNGLHPWAHIGLTATPDPDTPEEQIIYRYPLAMAIADQLVKTPVIVGRKDDRNDTLTKLNDTVRLLELKEEALAAYANATPGVPLIKPLALIVAASIADADEFEQILTSPDFAEGRYSEKVLTVHSSAPDEALEQLDKLDDPDNDVRICISVGMLKEGWDCKRVYVINSMRASVSDVLTEQTLGRGLRLPFGQYTGIEFLDTLEVIGHERYEELLRRKDVLNEAFVDRHTRIVLKKTADGKTVPRKETSEVGLDLVGGSGELTANGGGEAGTPEMGGANMTSLEDETERGEAEIAALQQELRPRDEAPEITVPVLKMGTIESKFDLADITDFDRFEQLGKRIAADPADELRRMVISAELATGPDGMKQTRLVTSEAADRVISPGVAMDDEQARKELIMRLMGAPMIPGRADQIKAADPIINAFLDGLGEKAGEILAAHMDRAAAALIREVADEQKKAAPKPEYEEVAELRPLRPVRKARPKTSKDRTDKFQKGVGYEGYTKSAFPQDWFDSGTERDCANLLDAAKEIKAWMRLQRGDLPILWHGAGSWYNPDFIAVEELDGTTTNYIIETKADDDLLDVDVQEKRKAARRWANYVSKDAAVAEKWEYLLVSETDLKTVKGSWPALKKLAS